MAGDPPRFPNSSPTHQALTALGIRLNIVLRDSPSRPKGKNVIAPSSRGGGMRYPRRGWDLRRACSFPWGEPQFPAEEESQRDPKVAEGTHLDTFRASSDSPPKHRGLGDENVIGYRGDRKLIVKVVIPVLLAIVMGAGAWGTSIVPIATPAANGGGGPTTPSGLRSGEMPSALSGGGPGGQGDASAMDVSRDVSQGIVVNEKVVGQPNVKMEPTILQYDPVSGRAWNQYNQVLTLDAAIVPKDSGLSFVSRAEPRTESAGPAPTAGGLSAGGPYGGANTFEGDTITFTAVVTDPSLIFFRWDFDNNGKWDSGVVGNPWVSTLTATHTYYDDYYGVVAVERWDGMSSTSIRYTGWSMGPQPPSWYLLYFYDWTIGVKVKAKQTMTVNQLSFYRYSSSTIYGDKATVWDANTQAKLAECAPPAGAGWVRCTLSSAIQLTAGKEYMVSQRLGDGASGFNYYYGRGIDKPSDTDQVSWGGMYYALFTPVPAFPATFWLDTPILAAEFYYDYSLSFPLTVRATGQVTVNNVAPIVYDLKTNPGVVLEGQNAQFSAMFTDPGLDDQWTFRWCYGDGTCDAWGGIRVGSGLHQLSNILVYSDVPPHYATQALDFYGVPYTFTTSIFALPALINSKQWDLIIYQSYYIAYIAPIIEDAMMVQKNGGALLMYNNWYAFSRQTHPILQYFGGQWVSDLFSPLTMYQWDTTNTLFHDPLEPPVQMNPTHNQYFRDGQLIKALSNAFAPMGYTTNPQDSQASMVVRNDLRSIWNGFTPQNYQADQDFDGDPDMLELMVNEIRLVTGPEVPRTMPWPVPTVKHAYRDDDPVTGTPSDMFDAKLELKDDDDGKLRGGTFNALTNFETGSPWPTGWAQTRGFAWTRGYSGYLASNSALFWYFYDWSETLHTLRSASYDLSGMDPPASIQKVTLSYRHSWQSGYSPFDPAAFQDGTVEVSTDNFATSYLEAEYHEFNPTMDQGTRTFDITSIAKGQSNVQVRFNIVQYDDWWWHIDDVQVYAEWGTPIVGLGTGTTPINVNNVEPTMYGGFQRGLSGEATPVDFRGFKIQDPTLWNPNTGAWDPQKTEWFAYRWNFDDGVQSAWNYKGSLEVPKLKVLFLNTLSFGTGDSFIAKLRAIDVVGQLDSVDFLFLSPAQLPTLNQMLGYDVILFATNYAIFSSTFDLTRREIGNRLATYMDLTGHGVVTMMAAYDNSPFYGDLFTMLGRYMDQNYGAFKKTTYGFTPGALGQILDQTHPVMNGVTKISSPFIHSGNYALTVGASLLAKWDDGNSAIGVKELANGARSVNFGGFSGQGGTDCAQDCYAFLRNSFTWSSHTTIPTNEIAPVLHNFGDNGLYNVDLQMIDDDMGFSWDSGANAPVAIPGLAPTISHNVVPVEIYNQDPTIDTSSIQAYIAANICLRVSGKEWNTVSLGVFMDGAQSGGVRVTRMSGSPNDQTKCAFAKIDLKGAHSFRVDVTFEPLSGATSGSNPYWVIIQPWRDPKTPGHGTVTYGGSFNVGDTAHYAATIDLPTLKQDLLDSGQGARIELEAGASDPGSDDLAFVWRFQDGTSDIVNIHNNLDGSVTQGVEA